MQASILLSHFGSLTCETLFSTASFADSVFKRVLSADDHMHRLDAIVGVQAST